MRRRYCREQDIDYNERLGRISFKDNPTCWYLEFHNGNPLVMQRCQYAYAFTMPVAKPAAAQTPKGVPCCNVRLASETLVLEVRTGNSQGAGSSALMKIRIFFDDWEIGTFNLNPKNSFYAGALQDRYLHRLDTHQSVDIWRQTVHGRKRQ